MKAKEARYISLRANEVYRLLEDEIEYAAEDGKLSVNCQLYTSYDVTTENVQLAVERLISDGFAVEYSFKESSKDYSHDKYIFYISW